jgi:transposase-like protein
MSNSFTDSFKIQAIEKALNRQEGISIKDVAENLGIGHSTLQKWIRQAKNQQLNQPLDGESNAVTKEKRPQDWSVEERLNMVISCGSLDDEELSRRCREKGIYPHHLKQWKGEFIKQKPASSIPKSQNESKQLKDEIKSLQKELRRKDKALAETAALLVLQKKVNEIWGSSEDS